MGHRPHLVDVLEPNQLVAGKSMPYPRRNLQRGTLALLIALRAYVMIAIPIVIYAFVHALMQGS
jgi:hypothetical protein